MIGLLKGVVARKAPDHLILDVGGVGYRVIIPLTVYYELPPEGASIALEIHTHVREDALALYGFLKPAELALFQLLITVSGIGPKLACNILSGSGAAELAAAIAGGDLSRLTAIPGIGRKTAERIVLELREKAGKLEALSAAPAAGVVGDATSALVNLGYNRAAVEKAVGSLAPGLSFEETIRRALAILAK